MNDASFRINLNEAEKLLSDSGLLKDARITDKQKTRSQIKKAVNNIEDYKKYVDYVLNALDYDFLLSDDSFFQFDKASGSKDNYFRYVFMQNPIKKISFREYCEKNGLDMGDPTIDEYLDIYNDDESEEAMSIINFPIYLRYDVDERGYKPNCHSYAHLHIGAYGESRLPVKAILTPTSFISIAIKMTYPDKWQSLVDDEHLYEKHYGFKRLCGKIPKGFWDEKEDKDIILT